MFSGLQFQLNPGMSDLSEAAAAHQVLTACDSRANERINTRSHTLYPSETKIAPRSDTCVGNLVGIFRFRQRKKRGISQQLADSEQ